MKFLNFFFFILFSLFVKEQAFSQQYSGKVMDQNKEVLIGASVYWLNTNIGTSTDVQGEFQISKSEITNQLIVSFIGYQSDTLTIKNQKEIVVFLKEKTALEEVIIKREREGTYVSKINPIKTKTISQEELTKGACCDLAGCFGTDASVQATSTNVITNSKELRIMGLSGIYTQVLIDGMPLIQGLSSTYGISSYPGTLVDNIYVAIGANSVLQGFESINGQINIQLKDPEKSDKFFVNLYANNYLEKQVNASYTKKFKKWKTIFAGHTTQPGEKVDRDKDTFLDLPRSTRYSFYNKWKNGDPNSWGFSTMIGLRFVNENRVGGQMVYDPKTDRGSNQNYGQTIDYSQMEAYTKTGYRFNDKHSIVLLSSLMYHDQNSYFGTTNYEGEQVSFYGNLQYELNWKKKNQLKTGFSFRNNDINENITFIENPLERTFDGDYLKDEVIAGVFIENVFRWKERITLITGLRADNNNTFGNFITPRAMLRYNLNENTTFRLSGGTGYRTINLFSENINLLASNRNVLITEELRPETAFNWGANLIQNTYWNNVTATFGIDFYRTQFSNQIFPDYEADPSLAVISNFSGTSISNGLQVETNFKFHEVFNFKISYNYLDVYQIHNDRKKVLPFNSKHKVISSFSYKPVSKKWHADANFHWFGKQNLATTAQVDDLTTGPTQSQEYFLVNTQFTKSWKKFEIYFGCENIFDFFQSKPINGWQNPYGSSFDTSNVWGPTRGREYYVGVRFRLE